MWFLKGEKKKAPGSLPYLFIEELFSTQSLSDS